MIAGIEKSTERKSNSLQKYVGEEWSNLIKEITAHKIQHAVLSSCGPNRMKLTAKWKENSALGS